jgi:hypothetical protein
MKEVVFQKKVILSGSETPEDIAERIHELEQSFYLIVGIVGIGIQNFISNSAYCTNLFKHNELRRTYIQTVLLLKEILVKEVWSSYGERKMENPQQRVLRRFRLTTNNRMELLAVL